MSQIRIVDCECGHTFKTKEMVTYCPVCGKKDSLEGMNNLYFWMALMGGWYCLYYFKNKGKWTNATSWALRTTGISLIALVVGIVLLAILPKSEILTGILFGGPLFIVLIGSSCGYFAYGLAWLLNKIYVSKSK
jgi:hypothetical protein